MVTHAIELRVTLQSKSEGRYTYMITRSDDPTWAQWGSDFPTPEAASKAGYEEAERWQKRLSPGTCIL
jgi:hypothetical protein